MAKPNNKETAEQFVNALVKKVYKDIGESASLEQALNYLVDRGILRRLTVRNYMILLDYDELLVKHHNNSYQSIIDISVKYDVCERQIKNIIYNARKRKVFTYRHNIQAQD